MGVQATGVDVVPEFIEHARTSHLGPGFRLGSMTDAAATCSAAGVLNWYWTIRVPPAELGAVLAEFRKLVRALRWCSHS